ncbi:MAG: hypothetical protein KDA31_04830 [Phycisphaerales bacterium]|nr:hypothetical protein [Phycisphaerales bacterium]MCB9836312.1 hypothetical protein [Phycisphaera sp.]
MQTESQSALELPSGIERFEFNREISLKPRQIVHVAIVIGGITLYIAVRELLRGTSLMMTFGMLSTMYCFLGVVLFFVVRRIASSAVSLDWDNQFIVLENCYQPKKFLSVSAVKQARLPMSDVIRADETKVSGLRCLEIHFKGGSAHLSENYQHYSLLRDRFDQLAIANNHPQLHVTMAELKQREFAIAVAIGLSLLLGLIAACVWFVTS